MNKVSQETPKEIYAIVHDQIIKARVDVWQALDGDQNQAKVDEILHKLTFDCPQKASDYFNKK